VRSGISEAETTNNKRLRSTFCIEAIQTRSIALPLCDSRASCSLSLLVSTCGLMYIVVTQDHVGHRLYFVEGQLTQLSNATDIGILFVCMAVMFRKS